MVNVELRPTESVLPKKKYPYVGYAENTGNMVFFTEPSCGVILKVGDYSPVPEKLYKEKWVEEDFLPISNTIEIVLRNS